MDLKMNELIARFPAQLREAVEIGKNAKMSPQGRKVASVLICGLGGSGIGGTIVSELVFDECPVPVNVCKGYFIPAWVNEETLVIISSYSGNTEETVQCMDQAIARSARLVCITSGGIIADRAKEKNLDVITIPGGMPPRSCLGYSLTQLLFVLNHFNLINSSFVSKVEKAIRLIEDESGNIHAEAKKATLSLKEKTPVIYCTTNWEGVAIRFRQQINENSKMLCWHHVIPEMNHNELVGWTRTRNDIVVVLLRHHDEYERNQLRIGICKEVFSKYSPNLIELYSKGNSAIEKAIYLINLGDWISYYLSQENHVDAMEVKVIDHLKSELSKT